MDKPRKQPRPVFRLLLVDDDAEREAQVRAWLPPGVLLAVARSGGLAIGMLQRDHPRDGRSSYGAILLDHDLQGRAVTGGDHHLDGRAVLEVMLARTSREVAVLIQSTNQKHAPEMERRLAEAGFEVQRIPWGNLTMTRFREWLAQAVETWREGLSEEEVAELDRAAGSAPGAKKA